jgi:hypothetical protein
MTYPDLSLYAEASLGETVALRSPLPIGQVGPPGDSGVATIAEKGGCHDEDRHRGRENM